MPCLIKWKVKFIYLAAYESMQGVALRFLFKTKSSFCFQVLGLLCKRFLLQMLLIANFLIKIDFANKTFCEASQILLDMVKSNSVS